MTPFISPPMILIEGRTAIADSIKEKSQELLDVYAVGLLITTINMQDVQPPEPVQAAFYDAVKAREDKQRLINEAQTYANDILPKSRGRAARILIAVCVSLTVYNAEIPTKKTMTKNTIASFFII
jgi:hypothetical protein